VEFGYALPLPFLTGLSALPVSISYAPLPLFGIVSFFFLLPPFFFFPPSYSGEQHMFGEEKE